MASASPERFEGLHSATTVVRLGVGCLLLVIEGRDVGELGTVTFDTLDRELERAGRLWLFVDARNAPSASIAVSAAWAGWLTKRRDRLERLEMLVSTRFVEMTAELVRRFAELDEQMRVTSDPVAFESGVYRALVGEPS